MSDAHASGDAAGVGPSALVDEAAGADGARAERDSVDPLANWHTLGAALCSLRGPRRMDGLGALYDRVAQHGIYHIDAFGRALFCASGSEGRVRALSLIKAVADHESGAVFSDDDRGPQDLCEGPDDPYGLFGWMSEAELRADKRTADRLHAGVEKTYLCLLAACLKQLRLEPDGRKTASTLVGYVQELGVDIDDDTVRKYLKKIRDALDSRCAG